MAAERRAWFDELVASRSPALLRSAYLLTGDWAMAEDLLQTALVKIWFARTGLREPAAAEAFVRTTMTRLFVSWRRRRWRGEVPTERMPEPATDGQLGGVEDRDSLRRALARLPARTRAMVVLRFYDDLTEAQVAELLGCSVGTVKSTVSRALAQLRRPATATNPEGS